MTSRLETREQKTAIATGGDNSSSRRVILALVDFLSNIQGTSGQVIVSPVGELLILSLPQSININSDVQFDSLLLNDLTASRLAASDANKNIVSVANLASWVAGTSNQISVANDGDGTITLSTPQSTDTSADVEFDSLKLDDLTASRMVSTDGSKKLVSIANLASWIAGTANEITVTDDSDGTITLSIPLTFILKAGTIDKAPLQLQSGPLKTSAVAGSFEFLTDKFYLTLTTGTARKEIKLTDRYYAEMYRYENTTVKVIGTANVYHAVMSSTAGLLNGFTCVQGLEGTGNITDYSGTVAGTVLLTDVAHGLVTGDIVTVHTSTNYNGTYTVTRVSADAFYFTKAYVSNQTADWVSPAYFLTSAGSDGTYKLSFNVTAFAATANVTFKFEMNKNTTPLDNIVASRKFATTDYTPMAAAGLVELVAGDKIWMSVMNQTNAVDITIRHMNINLIRS